jgi:DDE superfamily endonuclease
MPPGPTAPRSLAGLLAEFRPCFTASTFQTFIGLVVGLIAQTRRRTVCGMLTGAGLDQVWHHSRAHRLFTNARWSADALGLALADLIVTHLLPAGSPLTVAVDDTLFKRSGKKVFGAAWHHDGAAKGLQTHRLRQLLGRGRDRGAAVVSVPPGVPAGAGPALATAAQRKDRARPTAGRVDCRPLPRPDGARGRGRRLRSGTPAGNACATSTAGSPGPAD